MRIDIDGKTTREETTWETYVQMGRWNKFISIDRKGQ